MTKAMILAAGFGTRLAPLSNELPKPLVWVGDRAAILHIGDRLVAAGIREVVVNRHHLAEAFDDVESTRIPGLIRIITERRILGTGGGLSNAAELLGDGDVVVWNGDVLAQLDVTALLGAHAKAPVGATLAVTPRPRGEGTVGIGLDGEVVRLRGERFGEEARGGDFLGVSVVSGDLRRTLPIPGCLVGDGMLPWLRRGRVLGTFETRCEWDDIGSVSAYLRANVRWLGRSGRSSFVGPQAKIADGVELVGSVVGEGAIVRGEGRFEGCVVWPGGIAEAPAKDTVFTSGGLVVRG